MGFKRSYKCPYCNYKAFTSAGPDRGMMVHKNTFVCQPCQILLDLVVEKGGFIYVKGEDFKDEPDKIRKGEKCSKCRKSKFELWDNKNKPCPKCGTKLVPDPDGMFMNWD